MWRHSKVFRSSECCQTFLPGRSEKISNPDLSFLSSFWQGTRLNNRVTSFKPGWLLSATCKSNVWRQHVNTVSCDTCHNRVGMSGQINRISGLNRSRSIEKHSWVVNCVNSNLFSRLLTVFCVVVVFLFAQCNEIFSEMFLKTKIAFWKHSNCLTWKPIGRLSLDVIQESF